MALSRLFPCFQFRLEGNINKLDYSNNVFTEGFPHVWQYERTLEELNVSSTRINYLPPQLFYCQGLKVLLASNNNLETIPEAVGSLRQLQELNLSRNFISNVPDNIKSCKNLTHLDLSCNSLQKLPDAITCLISLQELILNETYLEFLPANFGRLVNLRIVELRSNNLVSLPKSMHRLINLQRLDIGCNEFTKMPEVIGELKQLRELWFDFNQIQTLPPQVGKLRELIHFEANGNLLTYLPNEIGNWVNVEVLSVSINSLSTFPFNVGMLKSLVTLKCESSGLAELPACVSNLENLEELVVSHNKLDYLPNTLGVLRKLRYLFADDNNLQKLPDEICSCSLLSVISVSQNKLSALPDNLGHLTNLKVLNIVQNNIVTLPISLLSLVNLNSLWISNNQSQPLMPLQYTEISRKTHLTCFLLPQLSTKQNTDSLNKCGNEVAEIATQTEQITRKVASCSVFKRRICFAEETTILQTDPHKKSMPTCENGNYFVLPNTNNAGSKIAANISGNAELKSERMNSKNYLMRSPTPYPKELRLMAKYVQLNHHKFLNNCIGDNYDNHTSISLVDIKDNILQEETNSRSNKSASHKHHKSKIWDKNLHSKCGLHPGNVDYVALQQHSQNIGSQTNEIHTEVATKSRQEIIKDSSPKPPPYHIARCFTKKSAEDLTKYEFTRQQQEQIHHFHIFNPFIGSNSLLQETNQNSIMLYTNDVNIEHKNNLIRGKFEQEENSINYKTESEGSESAETVVSVWGNQLVDLADTSERLNAFAKRECTKSRTKWLFGAHKNPRVIQVNVNWETGQDFEIDTLPNKEGIFVISTVSESNASQLIHPLDKLLEVEGVDFTNININEARQIMQNSRPSISIMLSRK